MIPWLQLCSVASALVAPARTGTTALPGNVLVIVMDDVGVDLVGAYDAYFQAQGRAAGHPANTPAIDQLMAAQGLTFADAWSCPSCTPTRAQLLTGRHPFRTGIGNTLKDHVLVPSSNPGLSLSETLLPELLHATGPYTCAAVGKWHLADLDQLALDLRHPLGSPPGRWFDRYAGSLFNLSRPNGATPGLSIYNDWLKCYASELTPGVNPCGALGVPCELGITGVGPAYYATPDTADDAITLLGNLPEPWFLYVAFNACHSPLDHDIPSGLPATSCGAYSPPALPCVSGSLTDDARCVMEALDTQMGRLLCAVDASDTTVIVVGDNGTEADAVVLPFNPNHAKGTLYQGGIQVPLIVRSPLLVPQRVGTVTDVLVSTADIFATAAEIAGAPSSAIHAEDSVSLVPYLEGHIRSLRATVYSESFTPNFTPDPTTGGAPASYFCDRHFQTLRNERFKLIRRWKRSHGTPPSIVMTEEFYDLRQGGPPDTSTTPPTPTPDPYERHNLLPNNLVAGSLASRTLQYLRTELDTRYPTLVH